MLYQFAQENSESVQATYLSAYPCSECFLLNFPFLGVLMQMLQRVGM